MPRRPGGRGQTLTVHLVHLHSRKCKERTQLPLQQHIVVPSF